MKQVMRKADEWRQAFDTGYTLRYRDSSLQCESM